MYARKPVLGLCWGEEGGGGIGCLHVKRSGCFNFLWCLWIFFFSFWQDMHVAVQHMHHVCGNKWRRERRERRRRCHAFICRGDTSSTGVQSIVLHGPRSITDHWHCLG